MSRRYPTEIWWSEHYYWLQSRGYTLRPRYHPDWTPSFSKDAWPDDYEDGNTSPVTYIMDATRSSDGAHVVLKQVNPPDNPREMEMARLLGSGALAEDPANHCIPCYDAFVVPGNDNWIIIVMPIARRIDNPRFDTVGEVLECFRQVFEGVHFMHQHHVAHRDCTFKNIMLDPSTMYPDGFHYVHPHKSRDWTRRARSYTRTARPPRYWLIDFGITGKYDPDRRPPRDRIIRGIDRSVPEHCEANRRARVKVDPFPVDVYFLGNWIRVCYVQGYRNFAFLEPLVDAMVHSDPAKRPRMGEVVARYDELLASLPNSRLRARAVPRRENPIMALIRIIVHWKRRIVYQLKGIPALPRREAVKEEAIEHPASKS